MCCASRSPSPTLSHLLTQSLICPTETTALDIRVWDAQARLFPFRAQALLILSLSGVLPTSYTLFGPLKFSGIKHYFSYRWP